MSESPQNPTNPPRPPTAEVLPAVPILDPMRLPGFRAWAESMTFASDRDDYLAAEGSLDLAVAWSRLLWPQIVVVAGCYLRADVRLSAPPPPDMTLAEQQAMESVTNHLHLYDVFGQADDATPLAVYEYLALVMVRM